MCQVTPSCDTIITVKPKGGMGRRKTTAHYICEGTDRGAKGGSIHPETAGDGNIDCIHTRAAFVLHMSCCLKHLGCHWHEIIVLNHSNFLIYFS